MKASLIGPGWISSPCLAALALVFGILMSLRMTAQVAGATVLGTITDRSGAVIPNARVYMQNLATGFTANVTTDAAGFYAVPNLLIGKYKITVAATGFETQIRTDITLTVGGEQVLNVRMAVGKVTAQIEVTTEAPSVQLGSSTIGNVVDSRTVRELPLNGRSWTDLAVLQPGIAPIQTQPALLHGRGNRGFGAQVEVSGARPQQNNYRLDGVSLNDYANGGPGNVLGENLGVDAIQEFSVLTSSYSAEYGKSSGGVVNAITRSGTNDFHGSAYEFLRNSALDARNYFDPSAIPPFKRNQFGASAGGPLDKNRSFVFGAYEGIRQSLGLTSVVTVPSPAARDGILSTGTISVAPGAQKYLALYGLPNAGLLTPGDTGIFATQEQQVVNANYFTIRVDHKLSEKDHVFGTYVFDNTPLTTPDNFNDVLIGYLTKRQFLILEENHTFNSHLVNSLRFGFNRDFANSSQGVSAINPAASDRSLAAIPGHNAASIDVPELSTLDGGVGSGSSYFYRWNSFQAYDDAFIIRGLHSLKFGVAVEREQLNQLTITEPAGTFHFGSLADFLAGKPQRFSGAFPGLTPERGIRQTIFGLYVQDDWHWRPNVTVNLGLRYEMAAVPTEVKGKLSNLYNLTDATPHLGDPYFLNPTLRNFEPRVGIVWDPFGDGRTAIRGAFGIYDGLPLPYEFILLNGRAAPFFQIGNTNSLPAGSFPAGAFALLGPSSFQDVSIEHKPRRNYIMQWNVNAQRELARHVTAFIGYVGSRGVHQPVHVDDADIVLPILTPRGYVWPSPVGSGTKINPGAGAIEYLNWRGDSYYDALELGVTKNMSHGLEIQGSYTWGKSIDTSSGAIAGDTLSNGITSLPWFDLRLSRSVSDFNVGRTLVISGTWQPPIRNSLSGLAGWSIHGWELGAIFKANDGVPFSVTFGSDGDPLGLNSSDPWDFPDRLTGSGCSSLVNPGNPRAYIKTQCFAVPTAPSAGFYSAHCDPTMGTFPQCFNLRGNAGRNTLIGPGLVNLDFSVFKNNPVRRISETFNVQFRAEVFNILNRANFAVPITPDNTQIFDSTGARTAGAGLLTSTTTTARQIQLAVKFIW
jgi:hypothetical protein